jgi:hypothetical protein
MSEETELQRIERQIHEAEFDIADQKRAIELDRRDGRHMSESLSVLALFEQRLALLKAHADRLRAQP